MNDISRIPPQALDVEQAFIGALLVSGNVTDVNNLLPVDALYNEQNQVIYRAILDIEKKGGKIDVLTVYNELRNDGTITATKLTELTSRVAGSAHLKYHAAILYDKYISRELIKIGSELIDKGYQDEDAMEVLQDVAKELNIKMLNFLGVHSTGVSIYDAAQKSIDDYYIRERNAKDGILPGVPTTLEQINKLTGGLQNGELIILAGRPSMGKTSVAVSFLITAAQKGKKCAFFSLEMSSERLMDKVICALSEVDMTDFKSGKLIDSQRDKVEATIDEIKKFEVTFNDNMIVNIEQIHAMCRTIQQRNGLDIIYIDYLQLMRTTEKVGNREQEISTMSRKSKIMATDLNVPVVLLSQLNRGVELRSDKRPLLADLRESGAIEQDADKVMFVFRPSVYDDTKPHDEGEIIIAKNREGGIGFCEFKHNKSLTRFSDFHRDDPIDMDMYSPEPNEKPF